MTKYEKLNPTEDILPGDIISIEPITNKVTRSCTKHYKRKDHLVIGICKSVINNTVEVCNTGIIDVNVVGLICIGDKLTTSKYEGKAQAIKYEKNEEDIFGVRSIGKVIGLYNNYNLAKVLLDIE